MACLILQFPVNQDWGKEAVFRAYQTAERELVEAGPHLDWASVEQRDRWWSL
jgi:hypothetical protein